MARILVGGWDRGCKRLVEISLPRSRHPDCLHLEFRSQFNEGNLLDLIIPLINTGSQNRRAKDSVR